MKNLIVQTLLDEMQRQNIRLKEEIIKVRRDLSNFQRTMMEHLTKIDKAKMIYQSPLECLNAFAKELQANFLGFSSKQSEIHLLQRALQENKSRLQLTSSRLSDLTKKYNLLQVQHKKHVACSSERQKQLEQQILNQKNFNKKLKVDLQEQAKQHDLQQIKNQQNIRVAVTAVVHSTREEMIEYRVSLQKEFMDQSAKLRQELNSKDQMFKKLAKTILNLQKNNENNSAIQWDKLNEMISSIVKLEELNSALSLSRQENSALRKQLKDLNNKKISLEVKINDLKTQILNQQGRLKLKNSQFQDLKKQNDKIAEELSIQKKGNKNLEKYFEQKWHGQFQNVKRHLQKSYDDKILEYEKEVEIKKAEITRRILSYTFTHEQDQKKLKELDEISLKQQDLIEKKRKETQMLAQTIQMQKKTIFQSDLMTIQQQLSFQQQISYLVKSFNKTIAELQERIAHLATECSSSQVKIITSMQEIESKLQQAKKQLTKIHQLRIVQLKKQQESKIKQVEIEMNGIMKIHGAKENQIKENYSNQLKSLQQKYQILLQEKVQEIQSGKEKYKQFVVQAFANQKALKKELKQVRSQLQQKVRDYQLELQKKKAALKFQNEKGQKDTKLKKELRQLLQTKIAEIKELGKQKQELKNELQAKQSQINYLNHELQQYKITRNDWLQLTQQIRTQFFQDYNQLKINYMRQISIFKSKIWELENIILKRPIRLQDQLKIRNLSQQKKSLQEKIEIKQAENGVLKQIKHYYQIKNETIRNNSENKQQSEVNLGKFQNRKTPSMLIMTKRGKKKRLLNFERTKTQFKEQEDNNQIRLMKRYIFKNMQQRESNHKTWRDEQKIKHKTAYNHKISLVTNIEQ